MPLVNELQLIEYFKLSPIRYAHQHQIINPAKKSQLFYSNFNFDFELYIDAKADHFLNIFGYIPGVENRFRIYIPLPVVEVSCQYGRYELHYLDILSYRGGCVIYFDESTSSQYNSRHSRVFDNFKECAFYCNDLNRQRMRGKYLLKEFTSKVIDYYMEPLKFLRDTYYKRP